MRQVFTTIIFLISLSFYCTGQNDLDSLEMLLQEKISDNHQVEILAKLTEAYKQKNIDKSLEYAEQLLKLSQKLNDNKHTIIAYNTIGISYFRKNYDIDTILVPFQRALEIAEENNFIYQKCNVLNSISNVYWKFGQLDKAFALLQQTLIIREKNGWEEEVAMTLANMANILQQQGDFKKAKTYYFRALDDAESNNSLKDIENISYNLAGIYMNDKQLDSALIFCQQSLDVCKTLNDKYGISMALSGMAQVYTEMKDYKTAEKCLQESGQLAKEMGHLDGFASSLGRLALLNSDQKKYSEANNYLQQQLEILEQNGNVTSKLTCYYALSSNYEVLKKYEQALYYHKLYHTLNDSIYGLEKNKQIQELETKYEVEQKELENNLLKTEKEVAQKTIRSRTAITVGLIVVLLLGAGWSFYMYKTNQERKAQNQLLLKNQQTIEAQSTKLQVLYDYKNKLFANVAHELRTPLTLIANPIKAILKANNISEQDANQLQIADRNIRSLSSAIYQILDLAKRENVELATQPVQFDVNELIQFIANDFRSMAQFKSIQFSKPTIGLKTSVVTDGEKLMIVIRNLLSNAFKFTPQNGQVSINLIDLGEEITVNIQDTGKGISKDNLAKIFDRHFQVNPANLPNEGGMGIGLSICKEYMTLLKGSIIAESELGKGSSFTIRFPKQLVNTTEINVTASTTFNALITQSPTLDLSRNQTKTLKVENIGTDEITKILVVEDNIDMSNYLQNILHEEHEVTFVQDGQQALEVLKDSRPDLIISDYMMPNMNGMELIEKLKNDSNYAGIPVIMLTAQQAIDVKLSALRIGVDDYLTKPFDNRELLARISNILTNQQTIKAERQLKIETDDNEVIEKTPIMNLEDLAWLEELENKSRQHISNPDFTLMELADEMAVSYSSIFRKVKSLTGLTANQYLREVRFQEALKLLEAKKYGSVKAVAYSVGYKNTKYFSKNFKKRFGKNPSTYLM